MSRRLTDQEIATRMVELRNLRKLHVHDRQQIVELKARVRTLEQEKADDRAYFEALIQKQAIQIAELQTMVFGRKRKPPTGTVVPVLSAPVVEALSLFRDYPHTLHGRHTPPRVNSRLHPSLGH